MWGEIYSFLTVEGLQSTFSWLYLEVSVCECACAHVLVCAFVCIHVGVHRHAI